MTIVPYYYASLPRSTLHIRGATKEGVDDLSPACSPPARMCRRSQHRRQHLTSPPPTSPLSSEDRVDAQTNARPSNIRRLPTIVLSTAADTLLEVRGLDLNPLETSIQMSWAGARTIAPAAPPSYVYLSHRACSSFSSVCRYEIARAPTGPVIYTFSPLSETSPEMVLQPPASSPDARPLFYTTATSDRWRPWLFKTALWRRPGGTDLVGALQYASFIHHTE
jgi:hypothetical protein